MEHHFNFWCFCGRVGLPQFMGKCPRHAGKDAPKKKDKQSPFRGNSKFQKEMGMFNGAKEN